ncbi:MAG: hypothetical protein NZ561_08810 [Phycisphaerae bacterium]|nr:hypothetical protein [Phycisphaerae bacterium]MDW8262704.1 hypothetical protein [Phycisphaerales bacterium]
MRFLIHGTLAPAVADAVRRHGHIAADAQMAELPEGLAPDELLTELHRRQLDVITNDSALVAAALEGRAKFQRCIGYLRLSGGDVEQTQAIDRLFGRYGRLSPRRLYTVTGTRVKVRQLPGA